MVSIPLLSVHLSVSPISLRVVTNLKEIILEICSPVQLEKVSVGKVDVSFNNRATNLRIPMQHQQFWHNTLTAIQGIVGTLARNLKRFQQGLFMLAKTSGTKCNHQPVHADCMAHQCSAGPSRNGKGSFLANPTEQPCSQQVSPSAGSIRWALENERDGNKGVHDWISRWGIFCTWCHAAATADNICQGKRADSGSVKHDNPHNVF